MRKKNRQGNYLWELDDIQFPRLIAEAEAAGAFTTKVLNRMSQDMDLTIAEISSVIDRAQAEFDNIKKNL